MLLEEDVLREVRVSLTRMENSGMRGLQDQRGVAESSYKRASCQSSMPGHYNCEHFDEELHVHTDS